MVPYDFSSVDHERLRPSGWFELLQKFSWNKRKFQTLNPGLDSQNQKPSFGLYLFLRSWIAELAGPPSPKLSGASWRWGWGGERGRRKDRHTFNGPFSGTTEVSRYQKGKTNLDFTEARDSVWQCHQLGHMQVCTSLQTDNHASTPPLR